jgi:5-methylcytosine-specific restriction protein A
MCEECRRVEQAGGTPDAASVTDHIIPHGGDPVLFWAESNWQAMSKQHHDKKTYREDGAFGRATLHKVS